MRHDNQYKMKFDWLKSEYDLVNKQIGAWSEADQKIIAVMATISVAIIGLTSALNTSTASNFPSYMLILSSALINLAVIQSSLYSSLILLALERKVELSKRLGAFLYCDPDLAMTAYRPDNTGPFRSYRSSAVIYIFFRGVAGLALTYASYYHSISASWNQNLATALAASMLLSVAAVFANCDHAVTLLLYNKKLGVRPKQES